METTKYSKPFLYLQNDWKYVLREPSGSVWVSCKEIGKPSQEGKIISGGSSKKPNATNKFKVDAIEPRIFQNFITIAHEDPNYKCTFVSPSSEYSNIHTKRISNIDVTTGGLGLSTCSDNSLKIWETKTGIVRRQLTGHIAEIYTCRFFPSGLVVLSGGADMQLKIWSAETGECPVTLRGHKAAIMDSAVVDKGRNVLSVSKDGTAKLWDCGQKTCLGNIADVNEIINCCSLESVGIALGVPSHNISDREILTEGKLLTFGSESGKIYGYGLQTRKEVFKYQLESAVNSSCFITNQKIAYGEQNGKLHSFDTRFTNQPLITWVDSASPILCIKAARLSSGESGMFVGRGDGSVSYYSEMSDKNIQLSGPDCDPVYSIATDKKDWFTASKDAVIRKYTIPSI